MARSRNIKPSFFRDSKVVSLSFEARLCFIGMWCVADYKGRIKLDYLELKMELFPADNVDTKLLVDEILKTKLISIYKDCANDSIVQIISFEEHQNPHINEKSKGGKPKPFLPSEQDCAQYNTQEKQEVTCDTKAAPEQHQSNPADSCSLIPDSCSLIPDSLTPTTEYVSFERFWEIWPKKTDKAKTEKKWPKFKITEETFSLITNHLAVAYLNTEKQYIPGPLPYLNGEKWNDEIINQEAKPSGQQQTQFIDPSRDIVAEVLAERAARGKPIPAGFDFSNGGDNAINGQQRIEGGGAVCQDLDGNDAGSGGERPITGGERIR